MGFKLNIHLTVLKTFHPFVITVVVSIFKQ